MADPFVTTKGGLGVSLQIVGAEKATRRNEKLSAAVKLEIAQLITIAALNTATKAKTGAAVDTGRLRASIFPAVAPNALASEVRARARYAAFVEFGTGPLGASTNKQQLPEGYSHGPGYFPPASALGRWAARHGIRSGGFVVARRIAEQGGTRARPFLGPAFEEEGPVLREAMQGVLDRAQEASRR